MVTCATCRLDKPAAEFTPSALKQRSPWCRGCRSAYHRRWYEANQGGRGRNARESRARRQALLRALKAKPCTDCGETFPPEAMDFDHVRGAKHVEVSRLVGRSMKWIREEVAKCDLVCANCHRIRTARRLLARGVKVNGFDERDLEPPVDGGHS